MTDTTTAPPCLLKFDKLRTWGAIRRSAGHTWRTDPVPHADPERHYLNANWRPVSTPEELADAIRARLDTLTKAPARDAVLCLEYLITARREAFAEHGGETDATAFFRDAAAFLERRHGTANVVALNVQRDEHSPHLVAYVVPIVERPARPVRRSVWAPGRDEEGRQRREVREFPAPAEVALSAWSYNGEPEQVATLQTEFAEEVAERHGLARGLEMSAATHTTNRAHHAAIARAMAGHIGLTAEELERQGPFWKRESPEEQADRLSELIRDHYAPTVASAATAAHDRRRAREMVETARRHRARYRDERAAHEGTRALVARLVDGLAPEQRQALERQAAEYRAGNRRAERERQRQADEARECVERRQREEAEAKREAVRARDDELARRLRGITPERFARLGEAWRLLGWRLLRERDDLAAEFERVDASGLVDMAGRLTPEGRALVEGQPERDRQSPRPTAAEVVDWWERGTRGPGL